MSDRNIALGLEGIDKSFDGHPALLQAHLSVAWGEVHALLGENGAGKSTLMNVVCGLYSPDHGAVSVAGAPVHIHGPKDATRLGIGMVHQHFKLVGPFTVAENVLLTCGGSLKTRSLTEIEQQIADTAETLGFKVHADARVDELSVAEKQRVEIIKLILLGVDILILDEPTAVLTDDEADAVLDLVRKLAANGKAVVLITHRLREVIDFADRVTIMRGGRTIIAGQDTKSMNRTELATAMVGDAISPLLDRESATYSAQRNLIPRLSVQDIHAVRPNGTVALDHVSFDVGKGEILGIAGVGGNGQTELAETIYGLLPVSSGRILLDDANLERLTIRQRRQLGLRVVPADRYDYALLSDFRAYENLGSTSIAAGRFGSPLALSRARMKRHAASLFNEHEITGGQPRTLTRLLSGGNAQKLLLARELDDDALVLVAHSPTRGLDVRACRNVHDILLRSASQGMACLLISEDLDEVLSLSHRILVLTRGRLHQLENTAHHSRAAIGELMTGHA